MKDLKINFEKRLDLMEEEIENKNSIIEKLKREFYLLLKQTSVKEKASTVLIYGKQTKTRLIQAVSEISARINGKISHIM